MIGLTHIIQTKYETDTETRTIVKEKRKSLTQTIPTSSHKKRRITKPKTVSLDGLSSEIGDIWVQPKRLSIQKKQQIMNEKIIRNLPVEIAQLLISCHNPLTFDERIIADDVYNDFKSLCNSNNLALNKAATLQSRIRMKHKIRGQTSYDINLTHSINELTRKIQTTTLFLSITSAIKTTTIRSLKDCDDETIIKVLRAVSVLYHDEICKQDYIKKKDKLLHLIEDGLLLSDTYQYDIKLKVKYQHLKRISLLVLPNEEIEKDIRKKVLEKQSLVRDLELWYEKVYTKTTELLVATLINRKTTLSAAFGPIHKSFFEVKINVQTSVSNPTTHIINGTPLRICNEIKKDLKHLKKAYISCTYELYYLHYLMWELLERENIIAANSDMSNKINYGLLLDSKELKTENHIDTREYDLQEELKIKLLKTSVGEVLLQMFKLGLNYGDEQRKLKFQREMRDFESIQEIAKAKKTKLLKNKGVLVDPQIVSFDLSKYFEFEYVKNELLVLGRFCNGDSMITEESSDDSDEDSSDDSSSDDDSSDEDSSDD
ncbi:hypothetical protein QTN25_004573 [Entamoeba marina]